MRHRHTIVWLDHFEAIVLHVHPGSADIVRIGSDREPEQHQLHRKAGAPGSGHLSDDVEFYARVAGVLQESEAIVVAGPGLAKSSFADYLERRFSAVARRVVGIETLDHPSDAQLREYADGYFKRLQNLGAL